MRSDLRHLVAGSLMMLAGCTEQLSIEPVVTSADNWTPTFNVTWYGYQRMALTIEGPPRQELVPNILRYVLSVREMTDTVLLPIDTLDYVAPSYVDPANHSTDHWLTDARVPFGKGYYPIVSVHYRNGTVRHQGGQYLDPDPGRGTILSRFPVGSAPGGEYVQLGERVAVWRSRPIFNREERLYLLDTSNGSFSQIASLLPPPPPGGSASSDRHRLRGMGLDGDTLVAVMEMAGQYRLKVVKLDLTTLASDTTISIPITPSHGVNGVAVANGRFAVLLFLPNEQSQVVMIDSRSGATLQTYPALTLADVAMDRFHYDGTDLWIQSWRFQENPAAFYPIKRLDPMTMSFTLVHRNPVEYTRTMALALPYAWIEDYSNGTLTLVKVRLEGF